MQCRCTVLRVMGSRLRELRTARGMSLRALAAATGLSATMLSQLERGVSEPSLRTLRTLAEVFGQSVATLFDNPAAPSLWVSREGARSTIRTPRGHIQYERLTPGNGQFEVLRGLLGPGENSSDELWSHEAMECAYVVAGTLTLLVEDAEHTVEAGEAITFDSRQPHRYCNGTSARVEFVLTVSPPTP